MYYRANGRDERTRYEYKYLTVKQYLKRKCDNYDFSKVFAQHNYKNIAIYGAGELGVCLCKDLMGTDVNIDCFIEMRIEKFPKRLLMGNPVISLPEVSEKCKSDVIVVTPVFEYNEIIDSLISVGWSFEKIMSLNEVVFG